MLANREISLGAPSLSAMGLWTFLQGSLRVCEAAIHSLSQTFSILRGLLNFLIPQGEASRILQARSLQVRLMSKARGKSSKDSLLYSTCSGTAAYTSWMRLVIFLVTSTSLLDARGRWQHRMGLPCRRRLPRQEDSTGGESDK